MTSSTPLTVRVIPGAAPEHEHSQPPAPSGASGSYAALLRRRSGELDAMREAMLAALNDTQDEQNGAGTRDDGGGNDGPAHAEEQPDAGPGLEPQNELQNAPQNEPQPEPQSDAQPHAPEVDPPPRDDAATSRREPARDAVAGATASARGGLTNEDVRFAHVTEYLLNRAADFCGDRAVQTRGNWQMQIQIDPAILPGCMLHLSLSSFELMLRFDTTDPTSKRLISVHAPILKQRLSALLKERGTPREVELVSA